MRSLGFTLSLVAAVAAAAQSPSHLVGLTRVNANVRHQSHTACAPLSVCAPAGFPSAAGMPVNAGGSAWDPIHSGLWISNGQFLGCVDDACNYVCPPAVAPGIFGNNYLCGLEVVESRNELWAIDAQDRLLRYSLTCPPTLLGQCPVQFLDPTFSTGGLAVDELNGLVFYARHQAATGQNVIAVADLATPCAVQIGLTIIPCNPPPGIFTGLACDAGNQLAYATDGLRTVAIPYLLAAPVMFLPPNCCPAVAAGDPFVGLAVRPGRATAVGAVCANGVCPACPLVHSTGGDSVLGNASFELRLDNGPAGSLAWCFVGAGPCAPPGVVAPPLCGAIYTTPVLGVLGAQPLVGGGPVCGAGTSFAMALPPAAGLAGVVLSSQCAVLCVSPVGIGTQVSSCLSFELQGI